MIVRDKKAILDIMRDGGYKICDHALEQWIGDKYKLGEDMRQIYIREWKAKREEIYALYNELKAIL